MDLEWFVRNTFDKQVKIESINTEGELGVKISTVINDAELDNHTEWSGSMLSLNDGSIRIFFEHYKVDYDDCLIFYRNDLETVTVHLPEDDKWV